ncbi:AMP-binding protein [Streptomyces sp. NPDC052299]|uniref:AMP-binding protein n=1 Tax=Streptomyces sp. NPDC052299 TaxID=3155054 RepID=UPI00341450E0
MTRPESYPDRALLEWLTDAPADRGLYFAGPRDSWDFHSYRSLARLTLTTAAALRAHGVRHNDVVVVVQRSSPGFAASLFGSLAAGATPSSIAPPFAFQRSEDYQRHVDHLFRTAAPALTICDEDSFEAVSKTCAGLGIRQPVLFDDLVRDVEPAAGPYPLPDHALLQFTSGSSGFSRGVRVASDALRANITAMRRRLRWRPEDAGISWMPVHHDFGLTGCLINMVVTGCDGWLMQPEHFLRDPVRYLRCISENRIGLTAMPNFGLAYILRRVRPAALEGLDFSALQSVSLGAERIDPDALEAIEALLGPYGFRRGVFTPAYGGAEATLGVTGLAPDEGWAASAPDGEDGRPGTARIVGCGRPMEGVTVTVLDEDDRPVPDGTVGEIVVGGTSVRGNSYVGEAGSASGTSLASGVLRSGDAGFLRDGQLFVLGRLGDGIKMNGKMVFAESLEGRLHELGVTERRAAVLLGFRDGVATAAVVMEGAKPEWDAVAREVVTESLPDAELLLVHVRRSGLAVTSSGKPRRRLMWKQLCDGTLADTAAV